MFPLKKNGRLVRLGEQPLHQNIKNEGGERFLHSKTSPPHSKKKAYGTHGSCSPKPLLIAFCFHFWCFNSLQQVSIPSLMFLLPIDVFSSSFGALICENMLITVRQFWFALVFVFLN